MDNKNAFVAFARSGSSSSDDSSNTDDQQGSNTDSNNNDQQQQGSGDNGGDNGDNSGGSSSSSDDSSSSGSSDSGLSHKQKVHDQLEESGLCIPGHVCSCTPSSGVFHDHTTGFNINTGCTSDKG
jgi:hypothetical protein